jgi:hypothetical protein
MMFIFFFLLYAVNRLNMIYQFYIALYAVHLYMLKYNRPPWAKGQLRSRLFIKYFRNREQIEHDLDSMNDINMWLSNFIVGKFVSR